ncbi:auxin-responsive protein IAA30-like [Gastrolobium bilobum]|uniref:auxin-responsive protein IAA30-like n=1 Tax=Gastrolobium bilobum TaxID=150636 RepID=UPI002AB0DA1D|nr:auxin-responsive protein IAA30-like [Gastrolobium bilobum]
MGKASSSSSSSTNSSRNPVISTASSLANPNTQHLHTDLRLGPSISSTQHVGSSISREQWQPIQPHLRSSQAAEVYDCSDHSSFFVKVYMEGIPIGRKLNLLAHDGYHELVQTLEQMFDTTILWGTEMDGVQPERCHVLTYEDGEGDLIMVGDVPWEMFLSSVKRLKITKVDTFGVDPNVVLSKFHGLESTFA